MIGRPFGTPTLDFLVIGAEKAGTTSLWRYLEDHPMIRMPPAKEAPYFVEPAYPTELRGYMRALFKHAPRRARLGTVTPTYMVGVPGVPVEDVAGRIHGIFPGVRLVALLRDPVERARSAHRMWARRGDDRRSFAAAVREQLQPAALAEARRNPVGDTTYVVAGEYGRILAAYLALFPREQLLVQLTQDLERDRAAVVGRVCEHIGVTPHVPAALGARFHESGVRRVSRAAEEDLKRWLDRNAWPRTRHPEQHRHSFDQFFEIWNVEPDPEPAAEGDDAETAALLRAHYAEDARQLEAIIGFRPPWASPPA